jgi:hypothetical protein
MKKVIELDCAPLGPRPDSYIITVVSSLNIPIKEPISKFFGCWKWDFSHVSDEIWNASLPVIKTRIINLHSKHAIRYGRWQ